MRPELRVLKDTCRRGRGSKGRDCRDATRIEGTESWQCLEEGKERAGLQRCDPN